MQITIPPYVLVFVAGLLTGGIVVLGLLAPDLSRSKGAGGARVGQTIVAGDSSGVAPVSPVSDAGLTPLSELAKHSVRTDCWLLIHGKVYDVTRYIDAHPGGARSIVSTCGTDATTAFDTKGGEGKPHSAFANGLLADYYIGDLGAAVSAAALASPTTAIPVTSNVREDREDDDDD
jgi:hypothetical protein